jgi:hypothetical protein
VADLAAVHPEIEGLLHEVAADPHSCLLRLPTDGLRRSVRRAALPDTAATTGLRPAERELLRTWRHETAYLLLLACYRQQITAPENKHIVGQVERNGSVGRDVEPDWAVMAQWALGTSRDGAVDRALMLLAKCASADGLRWPSVFALAAAANRLIRSDRATNYAALDLVLHEDHERALRMLSSMCPTNDGDAVMLAANSTLAWERVGDTEKAYECLRKAPWPHASKLQRAVFGLALAAQLGRNWDVDMWSDELAETDASDVEMQAVVASMRARRVAGWWTPSHASVVLLSKTKRGGPRTEKVLRAFL